MDLKFEGAKLSSKDGFEIARQNVLHYIAGYKEGLGLDTSFAKSRQELSDAVAFKVKDLTELFEHGAKISPKDIAEIENAERILAMAHATKRETAAFADSNVLKGRNAIGTAPSQAQTLRLISGQAGKEPSSPREYSKVSFGYGDGPV